ncbi:MAG: CBS domain-containing protein [Actinomycetota bacterium]|nr:CBS domain-containing protein [Actinomycetota bacterium]
MSPRAAWQLEALGFSEVYDFVGGKLEWISNGAKTEGAGPHYAVAGEAADRDAVLACRVGDRVDEAARELGATPHDYCVVLNDQDIVLGRIRKKNVIGPGDARVERVMEPGPTTVRTEEPAPALLERMEKRKVRAVLVTTSKGRLVGVATRASLRALIDRDRGAPAT